VDNPVAAAISPVCAIPLAVLDPQIRVCIGYNNSLSAGNRMDRRARKASQIQASCLVSPTPRIICNIVDQVDAIKVLAGVNVPQVQILNDGGRTPDNLSAHLGNANGMQGRVIDNLGRGLGDTNRVKGRIIDNLGPGLGNADRMVVVIEYDFRTCLGNSLSH